MDGRQHSSKLSVGFKRIALRVVTPGISNEYILSIHQVMILPRNNNKES